MKWIDWHAAPKRIAERMEWSSLLIGLVMGGVIGAALIWAVIYY